VFTTHKVYISAKVTTIKLKQTKIGYSFHSKRGGINKMTKTYIARTKTDEDYVDGFLDARDVPHRLMHEFTMTQLEKVLTGSGEILGEVAPQYHALLKSAWSGITEKKGKKMGTKLGVIVCAEGVPYESHRERDPLMVLRMHAERRGNYLGFTFD